MTGFDFKGVIFDLDGTLLDSMYVWGQIDYEFLGKRGFDVPEDYQEKIAPLTFRQTAEYTVERFNLDEKVEDIMEEWHQMAIDEYSHRVMLKPYAKEHIEELYRKGVKLAICTANSPELFVPTLQRCGVYHMFDVVITTDSVGAGKNTRVPFIEACKQLGLAPSDCAVFEDVPTAALCAKESGCTVIGIFDDIKNVDRMKALCDRFVYGFEEV